MNVLQHELQARFDERAAILEHDCHLSRGEAEAQAVRELVDEHEASPVPYPGIVGELARAASLRDKVGLTGVLAPLWGLGTVVSEGDTYRPARADEQGTPAVIVPACSPNEGLVDLVAYSLRSGRMLPRLGVADVVGMDKVDRAREYDTPLVVFENAAHWLRAGCRGAVVVDWSNVGARIDGVKTILCPLSIASRLFEATRRCSPAPIIATPSAAKAMCHAA